MTTNGSDSIRDLELKKFQAKQKLEQIDERMHTIVRKHTLDVESKWENDKDKELSNATKRDAEVKRRLSLDEEFPALAAERKKLVDHNILMQIDIDYLKREHQREFMHLMNSMLNGMFGSGY